MDVIFSWQWTRKCGNNTGDLYQSVSTWNIRIPYQSETGSRCRMQHTFALCQTKRQSEIHLVFLLLFNDAPSIYWTLTVCLPRSRWSQPSYSPIHRTPLLLCIILSLKLLFSIVPVLPKGWRSCCQLRGYILVLFCVILPYCILFMMYLSFCLQLFCCKSFFILFRPYLSYFIFSFFFLFNFPSYCTHFISLQLLTHSPSNNTRSNGFITSFSSCSECKYNSDNFHKWCNIPLSKWYNHYVGLILILILCGLILNVSKWTYVELITSQCHRMHCAWFVVGYLVTE